MDDRQLATLFIPGARLPRSILALLASLVVVGGAAGPWLTAPKAGPVEGLLCGALLGLFLWSIVALPWLVRKAFLGLRLDVAPDRIVVRPRFGPRRRIPLASTTCVVFSRALVQSSRSVEERWRVEVVTGASESAVAPLLADPRATSDDALRIEVGDWGLLGAAAARGAAEWIARRTRARFLDRSGPVPVRLEASALDLTYREKLRRAPSLILPPTPRPPEFVDEGALRAVSWKSPDSWLFWTGVVWCCLAATGWTMALREGALSGEGMGLPALAGILFAAFGLLVLLVSVGLRSRIAIDAESLRCEQTAYGLCWSASLVPLARIEDVTWQEPLESPWLPPARRVVVVADEAWTWVHVRNEASARWLVGWLQQALSVAQEACPPSP